MQTKSTFSFITDFQKQMAEYLAAEYMEYINGENLSVSESAAGFDLNGDGDMYDTVALTDSEVAAMTSADRAQAFIGPPGVGKTHLAEAYGRACCETGLKAYFLKASELKEKFVAARRYGLEAGAITTLIKPPCLIIDEVVRCVFDHESTRMFFDMIDRRYEKEGANCMIFTSNKQPNDWSEFFRSEDDLKAALDRLFDDAKVITIKGESYRGRKWEILAVEAGETASHHKA